METVYIVLIVAVVVLAVAWMYRERLSKGWVKGSKEGLEAGLEAESRPESNSPAGDAPPRPTSRREVSENVLLWSRIKTVLNARILRNRLFRSSIEVTDQPPKPKTPPKPPRPGGST